MWLTEWGSSAGEKAASYLGAADTYRYLLQLVKQGEGALVLPPYSINVISDFADTTRG